MPCVLPTEAEWRLFLQWAAAEGWTVPFSEQRLFQNGWRPYFFVLRYGGAARGFVSAVVYKESGWIGNLLVDPEQRGRGYGATLFGYAMRFLRQAGVPRLWLTASTQGRPMYERRGFVSVDRVQRWVGKGLGGSERQGVAQLDELIALDARCWGESRGALLRSLADDGELCGGDDTLALLQPGRDSWQLGPWLSPQRCPQRCPRQNRLLLTEALEKTPTKKPLLADVLLTSEMDLLLRAAGFTPAGSNELMCLADERPRLDGVLALASLGSIG